MLKPILGNWYWERLPDHAFCTLALLFYFPLFNRQNLIQTKVLTMGRRKNSLQNKRYAWNINHKKLSIIRIRKKFKCLLLNKNTIFRSSIAVLDATSNFNIEFSANSVKKQTTNKIFPKSISCHQLKFPVESTDSDSLEDECVEHHIVADKQVSI